MKENQQAKNVQIHCEYKPNIWEIFKDGHLLQSD